MYTETLIQDLINCPKFIVESPKRDRDARAGYYKTKFRMRSLDFMHDFSGFINQNLAFPENFSVGLIHVSKGEFGKVVLLRCNGPHGNHLSIPHHAGCHIHYATAERIRSGLRPEGIIEMTTDYITVEEAVQMYLHRINLSAEDRKKYFPPPSTQYSLFDYAGRI